MEEVRADTGWRRRGAGRKPRRTVLCSALRKGERGSRQAVESGLGTRKTLLFKEFELFRPGVVSLRRQWFLSLGMDKLWLRLPLAGDRAKQFFHWNKGSDITAPRARHTGKWQRASWTLEATCTCCGTILSAWMSLIMENSFKSVVDYVSQ